jgi:hypothetical protein
MSDIYNKNAREKALLEEAYTSVYSEEFNPRRDAPEHSEGDPHPAQRAAEVMIGAEVMWDGQRKRGQVEEVDVENGVAVVYDEDGGEHIVELGDFDVVLNPESEEGESNFKVGDWVYDSDGSHASIISIDGDEVALYDGKEGWTTHISEIKPEGFGEGLYPKSLGGGGSITSSQKFLGDEDNEEGELSDDWMKQDHESRQEERGGDHAKGVKMAIEALGMLKDELHIDGHSEDINVNELADAHDQLSRALHWILDETDVEYITGGRADRAAERDLDFKPADGREY